jgi:hypothetical protein
VAAANAQLAAEDGLVRAMPVVRAVKQMIRVLISRMPRRSSLACSVRSALGIGGRTSGAVPSADDPPSLRAAISISP